MSIDSDNDGDNDNDCKSCIIDIDNIYVKCFIIVDGPNEM